MLLRVFVDEILGPEGQRLDLDQVTAHELDSLRLRPCGGLVAAHPGDPGLVFSLLAEELAEGLDLVLVAAEIGIGLVEFVAELLDEFHTEEGRLPGHEVDPPQLPQFVEEGEGLLEVEARVDEIDRQFGTDVLKIYWKIPKASSSGLSIIFGGRLILLD